MENSDASTFMEFSYSKHANHFENQSEFSEELVSSWLRDDTADAWRHSRGYEAASLINSRFPGSWLTVGDGRWGLDSIRLKRLQIHDVLPSDIADTFLRKAQEEGIIDAFSIENAEQLSFEDKSFDYVFCKESLHHFPRPYMALHEMVRVARNAVILIEPNDPASITPGRSIQTTALLKYVVSSLRHRRLMFGSLKSLFRLKTSFNEPAWEPSGNYTYPFSSRDIQKFAYGLNLHGYWVKGLNDHYIEGCEFEPANVATSTMFAEIVSRIKEKDQACKNGDAEPDLLMHVIVLNSALDECGALMKENNWEVFTHKPNPYV